MPDYVVYHLNRWQECCPKQHTQVWIKLQKPRSGFNGILLHHTAFHGARKRPAAALFLSEQGSLTEAKPCPNRDGGKSIGWGCPIDPLRTVSFDWFLSGLEWILNLEFCLIKLLIFYQKLLWNIRPRFNFSTFWVLEPVFKICLIKIKAFCTKNEDFDQIWLNTGSKTQDVGKLSLHLIFYNICW